MPCKGSILEESRWERPVSRRGGGGEERGGDACIALAGVACSQRAPTEGDASIPSPLLTAPAPTRLTMTMQNNLPLKAPTPTLGEPPQAASSPEELRNVFETFNAYIVIET